MMINYNLLFKSGLARQLPEIDDQIRLRWISQNIREFHDFPRDKSQIYSDMPLLKCINLKELPKSYLNEAKRLGFPGFHLHAGQKFEITPDGSTEKILLNMPDFELANKASEENRFVAIGHKSHKKKASR